MSYHYLASPYSHNLDSVRAARYDAAMMHVSVLLKLGIQVYSPIVHCHEMAVKLDMPKNFEFWRDYNFAMLEPAEALRILMLDGFKDSIGVNEEVKFAYKLNKPVIWDDWPTNMEQFGLTF